MKRWLLGLVCMVCLAHFNPAPAWAAWSFHIANEGMDATWEIWLKTDETLNTNGYGLAFAYDYEDGKLEWDGAYTNTPPTGLTADIFSAPNEQPTPGTITNFNAGRFSGLTTIDQDMLIGTLILSYGGGRRPALGDLEWKTDDPLISVYINGSSYDGAQLAAGGNLTVVPVPGAFWLLGSALIAAGAGRKGFRRS